MADKISARCCHIHGCDTILETDARPSMMQCFVNTFLRGAHQRRNDLNMEFSLKVLEFDASKYKMFALHTDKQ